MTFGTCTSFWTSACLSNWLLQEIWISTESNPYVALASANLVSNTLGNLLNFSENCPTLESGHLSAQKYPRWPQFLQSLFFWMHHWTAHSLSTVLTAVVVWLINVERLVCLLYFEYHIFSFNFKYHHLSHQQYKFGSFKSLLSLLSATKMHLFHQHL
jgi:hypothetical protein